MAKLATYFTKNLLWVLRTGMDRIQGRDPWLRELTSAVMYFVTLALTQLT